MKNNMATNLLPQEMRLKEEEAKAAAQSASSGLNFPMHLPEDKPAVEMDSGKGATLTKEESWVAMEAKKENKPKGNFIVGDKPPVEVEPKISVAVFRPEVEALKHKVVKQVTILLVVVVIGVAGYLALMLALARYVQKLETKYNDQVAITNQLEIEINSLTVLNDQ